MSHNSTQQTAYHYGENRYWESVPGLLVWSTFFLAIGLSFVAPIWAIVFIVLFDLYWLFRVMYFVIFLTISWKKHKETDDKQSGD